MKKTIAMLIALLLCACALAEGVVTATGSVNLRSGPGLGYDKIASVSEGTVLAYSGESRTDDRGVAWYQVIYEGDACWVSSRYAEVEEFSQAHAFDAFEPVLEYDPAAVAGYAELIPWYGKAIGEGAEALGLDQSAYVESEIPNRRYNESVQVGGWDVIEFFELIGQGYTLYGVHPGMTVDAARQALEAAGLIDNSPDWCLCFEHRIDETSIVDFDAETDYNVLVEYNDDDVVERISLSTYSG